MANTILKKRVDLSGWSMLLTFSILALVAVICIWQLNQHQNVIACMILLTLIVVLCLVGLFYSPMILRLTDDSLNVETSFRVKKFPLSEIEEVRICPPTMAERRLFGSGGFMGYWGWFSERSIGKYFAYYGRASQTFLIRLKSGRQYMLGCRDSKEMADALTNLLTQKMENH